jgi:hypothetical protein
MYFAPVLTQVIRELKAEAFVTLYVGEARAPFVVMKSVLCRRSEYFRATFEGEFKEATDRITDLPNVEPTIFSLILQWFYTGQVFFSDGKDVFPPNLDPATTFDNAIEMFLFADQYDTRSLRLAIFDKIAPIMIGKVSISHPGITIVFQSIQNFPETSGLRKLLVDRLLYNWMPRSQIEVIKAVKSLPEDVVARLIYEDRGNGGSRPRGGKSTRPWELDVCQYHEHLNDAEREQCAEEMEARIKSAEQTLEVVKLLSKHQVQLDPEE